MSYPLRWLSSLRSLLRVKKENLSASRVADYYNQWTDRYEEGFGHTFQSNRTADISVLLAHIAAEAELEAGQRVLDAGCGIGGPALWFAQEIGVRVDALTNSSVQVRKVQERVEREGLGSRVRVVEGDFHKLENHFSPEGYDAVLFLESLVHSHHPQKVIQSVARVLRPGGILYLKDLFQLRGHPHGSDYWRIQRVIENTNRYFRLKVQKTKVIEKGLKKAGLQLEYFRELPLITEHDLGNAFCARHGLDIYEGEPVTYLDWLELKARK